MRLYFKYKDDNIGGAIVNNWPEGKLRSSSFIPEAGEVYRAWDRFCRNRYLVADGVRPLRKLNFYYSSQVPSVRANIMQEANAYREIEEYQLEELLNAAH